MLQNYLGHISKHLGELAWIKLNLTYNNYIMEIKDNQVEF